MSKVAEAERNLRLGEYNILLAGYVAQHGFINPKQFFCVVNDIARAVYVDDAPLGNTFDKQKYRIVRGRKGEARRIVKAIMPHGFLKARQVEWQKENAEEFDWRKKAEESRLEQQLDRHLNEPDKEQVMNTTEQLPLTEEHPPTAAEIKKKLNEAKLKERIADSEKKAAAREQKELEKMLAKAEKAEELSRADFKHVEISNYSTGKVHGVNNDPGFNFQVHRKSNGHARKYLGCITPERDKVTDELLPGEKEAAFKFAKKCCGMLDKALDD